MQTSSDEHAEALDAELWTYRDDSFLPHGLPTSEFAADQPILLLSDAENRNNADVRFLVDGVPPGAIEPYRRVVILFDGNDQEAVETAREWWRQVPREDHKTTFWQQGEDGRWEEKAPTE